MKATPKLDPCAAMVDELGALDQEISPLAPKIARRDALRRQLREAYSDKSEGMAFLVSGERFIAVLGAKGWESSVNVAKLAKLISAKAFLQIARVTLGSLATLPGGAPADCLDSTRTGPRSIVMQEKGSV